MSARRIQRYEDGFLVDVEGGDDDADPLDAVWADPMFQPQEIQNVLAPSDEDLRVLPDEDPLVIQDLDIQEVLAAIDSPPPPPPPQRPIETIPCADPRGGRTDFAASDIALLARTAKLLANAFYSAADRGNTGGKATFVEFFLGDSENRQCIAAWLDTVDRIAPPRQSKAVLPRLKKKLNLSPSKLEELRKKIQYHYKTLREIPAPSQDALVLLSRYMSLLKGVIQLSKGKTAKRSVESKWLTAKTLITKERERIRMRKNRSKKKSGADAAEFNKETASLDRRFDKLTRDFPKKSEVSGSKFKGLTAAKRKKYRKKIDAVLETLG